MGRDVSNCSQDNGGMDYVFKISFISEAWPVAGTVPGPCF